MNRISILDFGASSSKPNNSKEIQAAINAAENTGATVIVPSGEYVTGTIRLASNITLYLEKGARLIGSPNIADYPYLHLYHNEFGSIRCLMYAEDCHNLSIKGEGTIDYNGPVFFDHDTANTSKLDNDVYNTSIMNRFSWKPLERPNSMIYLSNCSQLRIENIHMKDAACWDLVLSGCREVNIEKLKISSTQRIPNDDGIHISGSESVVVKDCDIVTGDDCIAISSITSWPNESRNIEISHCSLKSASNGIRVGWWRSKVVGVHVEDCTIHDSGRGIHIGACGSGYVRDVTIEDVNISTQPAAGHWGGVHGEAVFLSSYYFDISNYDHQDWDMTDVSPNIENISIRHLNSTTVAGVVILDNKSNIVDISVRDSNLTLVSNENLNALGNVIDMAPYERIIKLDRNDHYWLYADRVSGLLLDRINIHPSFTRAEEKVASFVHEVKGHLNYKLV